MQRTIDSTQLVPSLEPGVTLLETPSGRTSRGRSGALHSLVVDALVGAAGEALWIDARNDASTYALGAAADRDRSLRGLRIARAFTAYQHHSLVERVAARADEATDLVVAPCVAALYRDEDLPEYRRRQLLESAVATLEELGASLEVPVLVSDPGPVDELGEAVADAADHEVECAKTTFGYRFEAEGFETTVYWCDGFRQTTIPYWVELFGAVEAYERAGADAPTLEAYVAG